MKKIVYGSLILSLLAGGCGTQSVITEYGVNGEIIKVTAVKTSVVNELIGATADKTVIAWESGWAAYLSTGIATAENPTPHLKIFAGKSDKGMISALPNQRWEKLPDIINATKYDLNVSAKGIGQNLHNE